MQLLHPKVRVQLETEVKVQRDLVLGQDGDKERHKFCRSWCHLVLLAPASILTLWNETFLPGSLRVENGMEICCGMDQSLKHMSNDHFRHLLLCLLFQERERERG